MFQIQNRVVWLSAFPRHSCTHVKQCMGLTSKTMSSETASMTTCYLLKKQHLLYKGQSPEGWQLSQCYVQTHPGQIWLSAWQLSCHLWSLVWDTPPRYLVCKQCTVSAVIHAQQSVFLPQWLMICAISESLEYFTATHLYAQASNGNCVACSVFDHTQTSPDLQSCCFSCLFATRVYQKCTLLKQAASSTVLG